ncbi:Protein of unknown function [Gryllus bimaculatus]|nr:Protein of unknown function [Gryllus bimaculatus]
MIYLHDHCEEQKCGLGSPTSSFAKSVTKSTRPSPKRYSRYQKAVRRAPTSDRVFDDSVAAKSCGLRPQASTSHTCETNSTVSSVASALRRPREQQRTTSRGARAVVASSVVRLTVSPRKRKLMAGSSQKKPALVLGTRPLSASARNVTTATARDGTTWPVAPCEAPAGAWAEGHSPRLARFSPASRKAAHRPRRARPGAAVRSLPPRLRLPARQLLALMKTE